MKDAQAVIWQVMTGLNRNTTAPTENAVWGNARTASIRPSSWQNGRGDVLQFENLHLPLGDVFRDRRAGDVVETHAQFPEP